MCGLVWWLGVNLHFARVSSGEDLGQCRVVELGSQAGSSHMSIRMIIVNGPRNDNRPMTNFSGQSEKNF